MLRIAHLYPKLLNIYGDGGNVLTLKKRCEWRGIEVIVDEINVGDTIDEHDIYFIGGGQDLQQIEVSKELQKHKDFLTSERDRGAGQKRCIFRNLRRLSANGALLPTS